MMYLIAMNVASLGIVKDWFVFNCSDMDNLLDFAMFSCQGQRSEIQSKTNTVRQSVFRYLATMGEKWKIKI